MAKTPFVLEDKSDQSNHKVTGEVEVSAYGVSIRFDGYGTFDCESDRGWPIHIEYWQGKLRILIWDDINDEEPKVIPLEEARTEKYRNGELCWRNK